MTGGKPTTVCTRYSGPTRFTAVSRSRAVARATAPSPGRPGITIVALRGDLDMASAPALGERLLTALPQSARLLILDLREVTFCDAAGLTMLIGIQRDATELGISLYLSAPRPQVAKLLRITGLDRGLNVHPGSSRHAPDAPGS
ncbi:STAS domain-containing protein [Actinomadura sp. NPDC048021]|uniref:STAS domain-containing protein n=1 Tax=Actinomadura sp. NPDC048021 TaxID=3155385 RepID=UPI0033D6ED45